MGPSPSQHHESLPLEQGAEWARWCLGSSGTSPASTPSTTQGSGDPRAMGPGPQRSGLITVLAPQLRASHPTAAQAVASHQ